MESEKYIFCCFCIHNEPGINSEELRKQLNYKVQFKLVYRTFTPSHEYQGDGEPRRLSWWWRWTRAELPTANSMLLHWELGECNMYIYIPVYTYRHMYGFMCTLVRELKGMEVRQMSFGLVLPPCAWHWKMYISYRLWHATSTPTYTSTLSCLHMQHISTLLHSWRTDGWTDGRTGVRVFCPLHWTVCWSSWLICLLVSFTIL